MIRLDYIADNQKLCDLLYQLDKSDIEHKIDIDLSIDSCCWAIEEARLGLYDENDHEAVKQMITNIETILKNEKTTKTN